MSRNLTLMKTLVILVDQSLSLSFLKWWKKDYKTVMPMIYGHA